MPRPPARGKRRRWRRWTRPCRQPLARPRPPGARRESESATGADRAPLLPLPVHVRFPPLNAGASHLRGSARRDVSDATTGANALSARRRALASPAPATVRERSMSVGVGARSGGHRSWDGWLAVAGSPCRGRSVGGWACQRVSRSVGRSVAVGRGTRSAGSVPPRREGALLAPAIRPASQDGASQHPPMQRLSSEWVVESLVSSEGAMIHQPASQLSKFHRHVLRACIVIAAAADPLR